MNQWGFHSIGFEFMFLFCGKYCKCQSRNDQTTQTCMNRFAPCCKDGPTTAPVEMSRVHFCCWDDWNQKSQQQQQQQQQRNDNNNNNNKKPNREGSREAAQKNIHKNEPPPPPKKKNEDHHDWILVPKMCLAVEKISFVRPASHRMWRKTKLSRCLKFRSGDNHVRKFVSKVIKVVVFMWKDTQGLCRYCSWIAYLEEFICISFLFKFLLGVEILNCFDVCVCVTFVSDTLH